jgi:hypothetical protein
MLLVKIQTQIFWQFPKICSLDFRPPSWTPGVILNLTKKNSSMKFVQSNIKNPLFQILAGTYGAKFLKILNVPSCTSASNMY